MTEHTRSRLFIAWLAVALLAACSTIFVPQSLSESIAAGYVTIETTANAAATLPVERQRRIRPQLQSAKDLLDSATDMLELGQEDQARTRLSAAMVMLNYAGELLNDE